MPFKDILGQGTAVRILKSTIANEKIAGTYLFWGPEGAGKKMTALAFAQALRCEKSDLIVLEPKGPVQRLHIDTIREMQDFVSLRSLYGGWKVVILDGADRLTEEAGASLLKILEEPPDKTIFILVSSRPENILRTILSRCQAVKFAPYTRPEILTSEKQAWRKEILDWDSVSKNIFGISKKIADTKDPRGKQAFIMDTLHILFTWFRDMLFVKEGLDGVLNSDYEKELTQQAGKISLAGLWRGLEAIIQAQREISYQVNSRLVLDTLFLTLVKCTK